MSDVKKSRRGVYYDLTISPWEFQSPHGDLFKFRSEHKLRVYTRAVYLKIEQVQKAIDRYDLRDFIKDEILKEIETAVYWSVYRDVER